MNQYIELGRTDGVLSKVVWYLFILARDHAKPVSSQNTSHQIIQIYSLIPQRRRLLQPYEHKIKKAKDSHGPSLSTKQKKEKGIIPSPA